MTIGFARRFATYKRADLLRRKSLAVWLEFPDPNAFVAADPTGPCARQLRVLMPVYQWLRNNAR